MALLELKDIGKIYVSEGNVAVGIRGVNLSFERGEFVAITGQSGSGKSTLLNVISGMDSYEEGELFIEGTPTSHYMQSDWEEYREKYISFIFQDYNIIESFTVLENVELALMHIENKKERRKRALELLDRVGLSNHIKQKGSKLSGGQKQRTVIARALAKDSPIILADEPTGNLDSATSAEIIELLKEVSKDKLLIVVTHNFEQVEDYATRHIRVFDGAIESDHILINAEVDCASANKAETFSKKKKAEVRKKNIKNGITLGVSIFTSKPKLSVFICFLMIVGSLGIFLVTSLYGEAADMFDKTYMFERIDGRVVLTKQNGEVLSDDEIQSIADEYGAKEYLKYDLLLDKGSSISFKVPGMKKTQKFKCTYGEDFGNDIIGTYPNAEDEVLLYVPISFKTALGDSADELGTVTMDTVELKVTGVKYYIDNNIAPKCLFTRDGFRTATAIYYLMNNSSLNIKLDVSTDKGYLGEEYYYDLLPSYDIEPGKLFVSSALYTQYAGMNDANISIYFNATYYNYDWNSYTEGRMMQFSRTFDESYFSDKAPQNMRSVNEYGYATDYKLAISPSLMREIAEDVLEDSYRQVSFFFENDKAAAAAAEKMTDNGYIAVTSDTTYTPEPITVILNLVQSILIAILWVLAILFFAFFINLCSSRTLGAFKNDMAIMRSMGISVKVIRIGMYVRMLVSLIPAYLIVIAVSVLIYTTPSFNSFFTYLYAWQYALIFVGMLLLVIRITYKQIKRLFGESVKKSLKGGNAND